MSNLTAVHKKRQNDLILLMKINKLSIQQIALFTGLQAKAIEGYIEGTFEITSFKWTVINSGMDKYSNNVVPPPVHKVEKKSIVPLYVIESLKKYDNSIILIKKIKKREQQFLDELLLRGFDCRLYKTGDDHYVIENKDRFKKDTHIH